MMTSIYSFIAKYLRDRQSVETDYIPNEATLVEWIYESERLIGSVDGCLKMVEIEIENFCGKLPKDFYLLKEVKHNGCKMYPLSSFKVENKEGYYISDCVLHTSIKDGKVVLLYKAMAVDEDGLPLVRDTVEHGEAARAYIDYKIKYIQLMQNIIDIKSYEYFRIQWERAKSRARADDHYPDYHQQLKESNMHNSKIF